MPNLAKNKPLILGPKAQEKLGNQPANFFPWVFSSNPKEFPESPVFPSISKGPKSLLKFALGALTEGRLKGAPQQIRGPKCRFGTPIWPPALENPEAKGTFGSEFPKQLFAG